MKKAPLLMLMIMSALVLSCGKKLEPEKPAADVENRRTAVVTAETNLVIRAKPERSAAKLGVAPHGETVEILQEGNEPITVDGITAVWYRINYRGTEGWVFGGYLDTGTAPQGVLLKEETEITRYVGESFSGFDSVLKKHLTAESAFGEIGFTALAYPGYYIVLLQKKAGGLDSAGWTVTDAMKLKYEPKKERVFFPSANECKVSGITAPILAVAAEPKSGCDYSQISRAWTLDKESFRFTSIAPDAMLCRPECCGNECD